ncbi:hypothetical protein AB0F72_13400 [Actinoplanes sp. NPDC023936]|uniref:hypothetical protein n=1 Tax=Actinoplanes sp. NPDC023936 TaxID=3154910 RepID=UPI0034084CB5
MDVMGMISDERRRMADLVEATDMDWSWGSGPLIRGTAEAVMLALTGRRAALADLSGDGVAELRSRTEASADRGRTRAE